MPTLATTAKKLATKLLGKEEEGKPIEDLAKSLGKAQKAVAMWKGSAGRLGAARVLALVKAHHPNVDLAVVTAGRPASKVDGSPLTDQDFVAINQSVRGLATKVAEACESEGYYPPFDMDGKRITKKAAQPSTSTPQVPEDCAADRAPAEEVAKK